MLTKMTLTITFRRRAYFAATVARIVEQYGFLNHSISRDYDKRFGEPVWHSARRIGTTLAGGFGVKPGRFAIAVLALATSAAARRP